MNWVIIYLEVAPQIMAVTEMEMDIAIKIIVQCGEQVNQVVINIAQIAGEI